MTEIEPQRDLQKTVVVSSEVLGKIFPAHDASRPPSLRDRIGARIARRFRLAKVRGQFLLGDLQPLRCRWVQWRLRCRLAWMRLRHRAKL